MARDVQIAARITSETDGALTEYEKRHDYSRSQIAADALANYLATAGYLEDVPREDKIRVVRPFLRRVRRVFLMVMMATIPPVVLAAQSGSAPIWLDVMMFSLLTTSIIYWTIAQVMLFSKGLPEKIDPWMTGYTPALLRE